VGDAVADRDVFDEPDGRGAVQLLDRPGLDPLGEFVDGDQQMCHAASSCLEGPHHVQPPDRKGPREGDGLEGSGRQVALRAEALAAFALVDQFLGRLQSGRPVETVTECLGHQGPGGGVMPALALMDVEEDFVPFLRLDAALENAGGAAMNQLVVDDAVGRGSALDLPCRGLVGGKLAT